MLIMQTDISKKKNGSKYLIFDTTDENKELQKKLRCLEWNQKQNRRNKCC